MKKDKNKKKHKSPFFSHELLTYLMDHIPDVVYFKDKKGRLILVNKAHAQGLGLKPEDVIGKTDFDIHPKEIAAKMVKDDQYVIRTGESIIDKMERSTRADGIDNFVSTTKIPLKDKKGSIIGLIGITRDITRRVHFERLEKEKYSVERKLKAAEELRSLGSEFVAVVSHELRTPLAITQQLVNILYSQVAGPVNNKQVEVLRKIKENTERLKRLIDDLLDLSRIEKGKLKLYYSLVNLNELIRASSDFFKELAQQKKVKLAYSIPGKQINIFIDADRINQIISNLINNAIKFTEEGGFVRVEVKLFQAKVRIGVIDSGIGMSREDISGLFNRFTQASSAKELGKRGIGLGLSISKELVEKHGGEIWVESRPGEGSKFYFTLPRFHALDLLGSAIKKKIGYFLDKKIPVHLINLRIINYQEFIEMITVSPQELFRNFRLIINKILKKQFLLKKNLPPPVIAAQSRYGRCAVVLPAFNADNISSLVEEIKKGVKDYLVKKKIRNAFIAVGHAVYTEKIKGKDFQYFSAASFLREIYIGSEMRRWRRAPYKARAVIFYPSGQKEPAETIDVSEGGVCLACQKKLKTDSVVKVEVNLGKGKKPIQFKGRVAWMAEVPYKAGESRKKLNHKAGLEFFKISQSQKQELCRQAGL